MVQHPKPPSERSFGFLLTGVLAILGAWPLVSGGYPRVGLLIAAAIAALISVLRPVLFRPFNFAWYKFGLALHKIVSPIVLGLLFYLVVTPVGVAARLLGKNLLQRRKPEGPSYWVPRPRIEPQNGSMRDQF